MILKPLKMSKSVWESKHATQKTETSWLSRNTIRNMIHSKLLGKMYSHAHQNLKG